MMDWLKLAKRTRIIFIGLLFGCGLAACSPDGAAVAEADYQAKILGNWQGEVAGENETMSFAANGECMSLVRSGGFISTTLGQGATGRIRGTWAITGSTITLNIKSTEHGSVLNSVAIATIETLKPNALFVKSSTGGRERGSARSIDGLSSAGELTLNLDRLPFHQLWSLISLFRIRVPLVPSNW
jgi:hypothetical protein